MRVPSLFLPFLTLKHTRDVIEGNTKGLVHGGHYNFYGSGEKRPQRADIWGPQKSISRDSGTSHLSNATNRGTVLSFVISVSSFLWRICRYSQLLFVSGSRWSNSAYFVVFKRLVVIFFPIFWTWVVLLWRCCLEKQRVNQVSTYEPGSQLCWKLCFSSFCSNKVCSSTNWFNCKISLGTIPAIFQTHL